jgi:hypothetical protein
LSGEEGMKTQAYKNHPSEDSLISCALLEGDEEVSEHLFQCETCNEFVEDIRIICNDISSIEEEDVPLSLQKRILNITKRKKTHCRLLDFIQTWYRNPLVIGMITILAAIFSYFFFDFLL